MDMIFELNLMKMHGTGNDFLILNLMAAENRNQFEKKVSSEKRPAWVQSLCDRHTGVGADGLLFLEPHPTLDFQWDFYNSDGSSAEMCGNAARCVALYAYDNQLAGSPMTFQSLAGPISAEIDDNRWIHVFTSPVEKDPQEYFQFNGASILFQRIQTGVPHSVIIVEDKSPLSNPQRKALAKELRSHPSHGEKGSNVTFYRALSDSKIESISFERGVEDFTLACGTGVLAAGFHFCQSKGITGCEVSVPGGALKVEFQNHKSPLLIGPAEYVAEIKPCKELF